MAFNCDTCNYSSIVKCNYEKHMKSKEHLGKVVSDIIVSLEPTDTNVIVLDCPVETIVPEKPMPVVEETKPKPLPRRRKPKITKEQRWERYNSEAFIDVDVRKQIWCNRMMFVLDDVRNYDYSDVIN